MTRELTTDVLIVGGGLTGLACAGRLTRSGRRVLVVERGAEPGGRVATGRVEAPDGEAYLVDRGFQVLLDSYPCVRALGLDRELSLRAFEPGALVRLDGRFHRVVDPWRRPLSALRSAVSPVGTLADKLALARWRRLCVAQGPEPPEVTPDVTALEHLRALGFGPSMIDRFFRPFFGGIFLDRELATSARMLEFLFPLFAVGSACLPDDGMAALPRALAARLPPGALLLNAEVDEVDARGARLADGRSVEASAVVVAAEETTARRLLGEEPAKGDEPAWSSAAWNSAACVSFAADEDPVGGPFLVLDGDGDGPVVNLCVPSTVAPAYAPEHRHLVSAAIAGSPAGTDEELVAAVRAQVRGWFGAAVDEWSLLRVDRIPRALPRRPPGSLSPWRRPVRRGGDGGSGLFACGDWLDNPSIDGALASGLRAADAVLEDTA